MTRQAFDALVRRIEARYAGRQAALERASTAWMALGLAAVASWFCVLFVLGGLSFAAGTLLEAPASLVLLGLGVALIVFAITQAGLVLLVEQAPAEGRVLRPGEAPALWTLLDSLRRELQCRPFDEVRVSMDYNAGVREVPRLGLLGWPRTVLQLGLPLATVLTSAELRAVLAHEFVHISARHGRRGQRLYHLNRSWGNLFERLTRPATGHLDQALRWGVSRFASWYWPRLHARTLVLSRAQEHQADLAAAAVAGGPNLASGLWRTECFGLWLSERFWPDLNLEANASPEPPADIVGRMKTALEQPPAVDDRALWVERVLSQATAHEESHPAYVDRLRVLGHSAEEFKRAGFPEAPRPSAAEEYLGESLGPIEAELSAEWLRGAQAGWRARHRRAATDARRRAPAEAASATGPPTADALALWETARGAVDLQGLAHAAPLLRAVLERDPAHPGASVLLGHHLLKTGDAEGERLLLNIVERADEAWMSRACDALQEHYRASGQTDRLRDVRARLDRHEADVAAARLERSAVVASDRFLPHGLAGEQLTPLCALLRSEPDCAAAWLARKDVRHFPNRPLFVLCVRGRSGRFDSGRLERERRLVARLIPRVELPGQVLVVSGHGSFRRLAARVAGVPGSQVHG